MTVTVKTKVVDFSDGSTITVSQSNWDIAMRLSAMEEEARTTPLEDVNAQLFRFAFYPKLAACSSGDVPTESEARAMPEEDLDNWYAAVKEMNPKWFAVIDQAIETNIKLAEVEAKKKGTGGG